jgi:hypothetical protein
MMISSINVGVFNLMSILNLIKVGVFKHDVLLKKKHDDISNF